MEGPPKVTASDIDDFVVGVTLLGSGGGGDARTIARVLRRQLRHSEQRLHQPEELPNHTVVPVGIVGATSVFLEKLPGGEELTQAVNAVCRWTGTKATAVMPIEAGGLNGVTGLVAALDLGLPLLDVDLMGRALPRLDQMTWSAEGIPLAPCALCAPGGQVVLVDGAPPRDVERTVRSFLAHSGGWAAIALRPTAVLEAAAHGIPGSLVKALQLGRSHSTLPERASATEVEHTLGALTVGSGRVVQIARHHGPDPTMSSVHVNDVAGAVVRLETQNEYLLAIVDGAPMASTPDLICVLDRRTSMPIAADSLRTGDDVIVITLPGPSWWQEHDQLGHVGPNAFGLDLHPVLQEQ